MNGRQAPDDQLSPAARRIAAVVFTVLIAVLLAVTAMGLVALILEAGVD